MWELERTERLVTRLLPLVALLTALLLAWMSWSVQPRQLSSAFIPGVVTPAAELAD